MDAKIVKRFEALFMPVPYSGCWIWTASTSTNGYGQFTPKGSGENVRAHRFSFELYKGKIPKGKILLHSCDEKVCVNPDHLSIGTNQQNSDDMVRKKRHAFGTRAWNSKLTESDVIRIFELRKEGLTQREIASIVGVNRPAISKVLLGNRWGHVTLKQYEKTGKL